MYMHENSHLHPLDTRDTIRHILLRTRKTTPSTFFCLPHIVLGLSVSFQEDMHASTATMKANSNVRVPSGQGGNPAWIPGTETCAQRALAPPDFVGAPECTKGRRPDRHTHTHTYVYSFIHSFTRTHTHTYIHTNTHSFIHILIHTFA